MVLLTHTQTHTYTLGIGLCTSAHTHTHTAHIWFCFTNGVASDLTTPYKACLVPLILSWRMRAHTKTHTHTALIDYTVLGQRE